MCDVLGVSEATLQRQSKQRNNFLRRQARSARFGFVRVALDIMANPLSHLVWPNFEREDACILTDARSLRNPDLLYLEPSTSLPMAMSSATSLSYSFVISCILVSRLTFN